MLPLDPEVYRDMEPELPGLFAASDRSADLSFLRFIAADRLRLLIAFEQVDLDTLRLVGLFGAEAGAMGAIACTRKSGGTSSKPDAMVRAVKAPKE